MRLTAAPALTPADRRLADCAAVLRRSEAETRELIESHAQAVGYSFDQALARFWRVLCETTHQRQAA